jgi:hypothetical protein
MAPEQLIFYIKQQHTEGFTFEDVKKSLLEAGWDEKSIDEAYRESSAPPPARTRGEEDIVEDFSPPPSYKRAVKRFTALFIGAAAAILFIYIFMR